METQISLLSRCQVRVIQSTSYRLIVMEGGRMEFRGGTVWGAVLRAQLSEPRQKIRPSPHQENPPTWPQSMLRSRLSIRLPQHRPPSGAWAPPPGRSHPAAASPTPTGKCTQSTVWFGCSLMSYRVGRSPGVLPPIPTPVPPLPFTRQGTDRRMLKEGTEAEGTQSRGWRGALGAV